MTHDRLKHLVSQLLDYNFPDEVEDYKQQNKAGRKGHILHVLCELNNYAFGIEETADEAAGIKPRRGGKKQ